MLMHSGFALPLLSSCGTSSVTWRLYLRPEFMGRAMGRRSALVAHWHAINVLEHCLQIHIRALSHLDATVFSNEYEG